MKRDAEVNAEADSKRAEEVMKFNEADQLIFTTEKNLKEHGDKLTPENKTAIEGALGTLRNAHSDRDITRINESMEALNAAWNVASQEMYQGGGAAGQDPNNGYGPGGYAEHSQRDPEVSDVEYEEVKEEKR